MLTLNFQIDSFNLDRICVNLTVVQALIFVLDLPDVQVPVFGERPLHTQPLVVDDAPVFVRQQRGPLICPDHLQ